MVDNLVRNGVKLLPLEGDTTLSVTVYHIKDFATSPRPYEGHYIHSKVELTATDQTVIVKKGDFLLPMNQVTNRFVMEVLEPEAEDSYFAWNYFDTILQAKEGYSAYVFEDLAAVYLKENPEIRQKLERLKKEDPEFNKNGPAQLRWVFEQSPWYEAAHNRYPVYRIEY